MCKVRDAAMNMLKIALNEYHIKNMDYVKLYKLLYLGQCYALYKYSEEGKSPYRLFEEDVTAHLCGPYLEDLYYIPAVFGVGIITKERFDNPGDGKKKPEYIQSVSPYREETIRKMLLIFGKLDAAQLVAITKGTYAYQSKKDSIKDNEKRPILDIADMKETGRRLFQDMDIN